MLSFKKISYFFIVLWLILYQTHICAASSQGFYDDFSQGIDSTRWILVNKQWGGDNGGVSAENVHWVAARDHHLELVGHGNLYQGPIEGINGKKLRVGAAIVTRDYYASGVFSVCVKLPPELGAASAFWLFHYTELTPQDPKYIKNEDPIRNSEIDWETPSDNGTNTTISYQYAKTNAWGGQKPGEIEHFTQIVDLAPFNQGINPGTDNRYHKYEIIWHTGNNLPNGGREPGSVTWLFAADCDQPAVVVNHLSGLSTGYDDVPYRAARFWIGIWFPVDKSLYKGKYTGWAGTPNFTETRLNIKWISIKPFVNTDNRDSWEQESNAAL